ncbi:hypothetical protein KIKIMORA_00190 [Brevundimonas phage vB_BpoS-Kikimora]|uniref:Uncharacterized protein n=1 Tax=Brevundimonas phage vB_BpoS-Kikimora TaxID=2948601 RepID=A0A9E7MQT2_9CAUD|nr:hypothetical protein KIKIMORA_00190 [Brevundimonas phage vB_BpoS-Kikimora]
MVAVAPPRYWHPKRPPYPFYGPEDYLGWGTAEEEAAEHDQMIARWRRVHAGLSLRDRIRHFFSHSGCYVVENL